jgi:hypothetical protein
VIELSRQTYRPTFVVQPSSQVWNRRYRLLSSPQSARGAFVVDCAPCSLWWLLLLFTVQLDQCLPASLAAGASSMPGSPFPCAAPIVRYIA